VDSPAFIEKFTFVKMFLCSFCAVGYLKETFLKSIESESEKEFKSPPYILGYLSMTSKIVLPTILAD
jgi:hypothetical protein